MESPAVAVIKIESLATTALFNVAVYFKYGVTIGADVRVATLALIR